MTVTVQSAYTALTTPPHRVRDTTRERELTAGSDPSRAGGVVPADVAGDAVPETCGAANHAVSAPHGGGQGRDAGTWADEVVRCVPVCRPSLRSDVPPATPAYGQEIAEQTSPCSTSGVGR